jgi:hypothetical protein
MDNTELTPQQIVDKKNREIYINKAKSLGLNVRINYSDSTCKEEERKYYQSLDKSIGRPEAIRLFCKQCLGITGRGEHFSEELRACPLRWGKPSEDGVHPLGCCFNPWRSGSKYQPKNAPKLTQKKAIMAMCCYCQQTAQVDHNVKNCTAFWGSGEGSCPLHPYRKGSSPFREFSDKQLAHYEELSKKFKGKGVGK